MKTKNNNLLEIIGWYGPMALIIGFALVSWGIVDARSYTFQIINLTGGISLAIISYVKKAYQPAFLNIVFSLIALITITSLLLK
jgi:hypothetical protein